MAAVTESVLPSSLCHKMTKNKFLKYDGSALHVLKVATRPKALELYIKNFTDFKLFCVALYSRGHWDIICDWMRTKIIYTHFGMGHSGGLHASVLGFLPSELLLIILSFLNLRDLGSFGKTCGVVLELVRIYSASQANQLFQLFDVPLDELRFAMIHTHALISGITGYCALFPGRSNENSVKPATMDIYVDEEGAPGVTYYLEEIRDYDRNNYFHNPRVGLWKTVEYTHPDIIRYPGKILLHICEDHPRDVILGQSNTAFYGFIAAEGIFAACAETTFNHIGILKKSAISDKNQAQAFREEMVAYNIRIEEERESQLEVAHFDHGHYFSPFSTPALAGKGRNGNQ